MSPLEKAADAVSTEAERVLDVLYELRDEIRDVLRDVWTPGELERTLQDVDKKISTILGID
jgi:hypothetical protein